jgi:hypothetical protein
MVHPENRCREPSQKHHPIDMGIFVYDRVLCDCAMIGCQAFTTPGDLLEGPGFRSGRQPVGRPENATRPQAGWLP